MVVVLARLAAAEMDLEITTRVATTRVVYVRAILPPGASVLDAGNYAAALADASPTTLTQIFNTHTIALSDLGYVQNISEDPNLFGGRRLTNLQGPRMELVRRLPGAAMALQIS